MQRLLFTTLTCLISVSMFGQTAQEYFEKASNSKSDVQYQITNYTKCLSLDPEYAAAYYNRGVIHQQLLGNYKDAIADFTMVIKLDPDFSDTYYNRGHAHQQLGNYEDAIADYTRAIKINTSDAEAYDNRGVSHLQLGNYEDAITDITRAIEIEPDFALAYYNRGNIHQKLENYEDAIGDYTRAIEIEPDFALAYYNRGVVHQQLVNHEDAIADYTRVVENGLGDLEFEEADTGGEGISDLEVLAYYNRGRAHHQLGNYEDAIADYTRAIKTNNPYAPWVYNNRAIAKANLELDYCSDFKRACDLGECDYYHKFCK